MLLQVDIADLKVNRRGSSDSTKLDHHEIVCPTIGAVNVYLQVSRRCCTGHCLPFSASFVNEINTERLPFI